MIPALACLLLRLAVAQPVQSTTGYTKIEYRVAMRDGVRLYTSVYVPKGKPGLHPILLERTPYSAGPYGTNARSDFDGSLKFQQAGYIFAYQDVRGRYMSEGQWENVRPPLKPGESGTDESTDTWDTVDFLVKHVPENNGRVGLWGISYPGFYAAIGAVHTHPALKAISPQAPCSDWWIGDDVHHYGAFFLQDNFDFSAWFDVPRSGLETDHRGIDVDRDDLSAYDFYLNAGTSEGLNQLYAKGRIPYWEELEDHPNYDDYWKARSLPSNFKDVHCAVLTVGGWFDAEDMWGALHVFQAGETNNQVKENYLVMGPWYHGMWADGTGRVFNDLDFDADTSADFRDNIEFPFFDRYLRGGGEDAPAKATVFETGRNEWHRFAQWPPANLRPFPLYLDSNQLLVTEPPSTQGDDSYVSDPARPTPYLPEFAVSRERPTSYMVADQRFAESRSDVISYRGPVLDEDLQVAGPIDVDLWVRTTGTDGDFVVKVIDAWPKDSTAVSPKGVSMAGYEQLLRGDVFRGRFRNSFEHPEPFVPGQPARIHFKMNDVYHTFLKGHRIFVQVQSSWFPLVDRNPNQFVDTYRATPDQFVSATVTILHGPEQQSKITFGKL